MGRLDHQIKLRGFRIELGEIEAALARHPQVAQAVAMVRQQGSGAAALVAWLIAEKDAEIPSRDDLAQFLAASLPKYMVPTFYVAMDEYPLTPNGKINRSALPAPEQSSGEYVAPEGEREEQLAGIWAEMLGLDRVSRDGNFFSLGGDSILVIKVVMAAKKAGLIFTPKHMFQHQTLAELASVAEVGESEDTIEQAPPRDSETPEIFAETNLNEDDLDSILEELVGI